MLTICDFFYVYQIGVALVGELEKLKIEQMRRGLRTLKKEDAFLLSFGPYNWLNYTKTSRVIVSPIS